MNNKVLFNKIMSNVSKSLKNSLNEVSSDFMYKAYSAARHKKDPRAKKFLDYGTEIYISKEHPEISMVVNAIDNCIKSFDNDVDLKETITQALYILEEKYKINIF